MRSRIGMRLSGRHGRRFWLIFAAAVVAGGAASTAAETSTIDGFTLAMQLFGGLAIFLFGIDQMSDGLKAGGRTTDWRQAPGHDDPEPLSSPR